MSVEQIQDSGYAARQLSRTRGEVDRKNYAFSLAEVLITLGIIGIVAAMTMPSLIAKHQKKVAGTRAKAAFSQLFQAVQMAQAEYGDYSGWDEANPNGSEVESINDTTLVKIFADKYILPYLNTISTPERARLREKGYKTGLWFDKHTQYVANDYRYYFAELANGTTLLFTNNGNGTTNIVRTFIIMIDINGASGENRFGHDVFPIQFDSEKGFNTMAENLTDDKILEICNNTSCMFNYTELLKRNGWEIDDRYPW